MKRILTLLLTFLIILPICLLPISAEDSETTKKCNYCGKAESECKDSNADGVCDQQERDKKEESFWDKTIAFFDGTKDFFVNAGKLVKGVLNFFNIFQNIGDTRTTLSNGGFNFIYPASRINILIKNVYQALYPVGFIIMLICWGFSVTKSSISSSLDIKDKNSIIHSVLSLILALGAMTLSPQILTTLTGVSQWLCSTIDDITYMTVGDIEPVIKSINVLDLIIGSIDTTSAVIIIAVIIEYVFMINILWIALLQCLSPIFIGLIANRGTRKITFNFIKEYLKALMLPVVTLTYYKLALGLLYDLGAANGAQHIGAFTVGLLGSIVLAISTVSIAGKKLDKLIN